MRSLPYVAAVTVLLGALAIGVMVVSAQSNSQPLAGGGLIHGTVYGFNMYNQFVPVEWASVTAVSDQYNFVSYTGAGGEYEMFVPEGSYNVTVNPPGYRAYSMSVAVSDGSSSAVNFYLEQSGVPVPEFQPSTFAIALFVAMASVLLAKRATRRRKQHR
jgi:hypothetical protein